jgi:hypothetical protein
MKKAESKYKINELCRVFGISLSSYEYKPVTASLADINLMTFIKTISVDAGNTYGRRRVHVELTELGHEIGVYKTLNLMDKLNISAIRPKKRRYAYFTYLLIKRFYFFSLRGDFSQPLS